MLCLIQNIFEITKKDAPERRHGRREGVIIVNFRQISRIILVFPLMTWNKLIVADNKTIPAQKYQ